MKKKQEEKAASHKKHDSQIRLYGKEGEGGGVMLSDTQIKILQKQLNERKPCTVCSRSRSRQCLDRSERSHSGRGLSVDRHQRLGQ